MEFFLLNFYQALNSSGFFREFLSFMPIIFPLKLHFYPTGAVTLGIFGNTVFIRAIVYPPDGKKIRDTDGTITDLGKPK
jgi:hypothetical protein